MADTSSTSFLTTLFQKATALKHHCLLCADSSPTRICESCEHYFIQPPHICQGCALPLAHTGSLCGECLQKPPAFAQAFSPFIYQAPLSRLITRFKHQSDLVAGKALGERFAQAVAIHYQQNHLRLPEQLIAVPLHWQRQWQRGFNQSQWLTDHLARHLDIPVLHGVKKNRITTAQEHLPRKQRLKNLTNSFTITQGLTGQSIAIVDDVMTTGATANSLAITLKKAGAGSVTIWALARTPKPR